MTDGSDTKVISLDRSQTFKIELIDEIRQAAIAGNLDSLAIIAIRKDGTPWMPFSGSPINLLGALALIQYLLVMECTAVDDDYESS
jgi:hypothetical protein